MKIANPTILATTIIIRETVIRFVIVLPLKTIQKKSQYKLIDSIVIHELQIYLFQLVIWYSLSTV